MSRNTHLNSVKILKSNAYPLPQVHNPVGQVHGAMGSASGRRRHILGLGVNTHTGRLQWCPGFTCCKFLVLLPVVMLPITLVLVLLMRMDGMLTALHLQQQQQQQQHQRQLQDQQYDQLFRQEPATYFDDDYENEGSHNLKMLRDEQFVLSRLPTQQNHLDISEMERSKRCMPYRYGTSETFDLEDRELMKDARTSFLPPYMNPIPSECLDVPHHRNTQEQSEGEQIDFNWDDHSILTESARRERTRRTSDMPNEGDILPLPADGGRSLEANTDPDVGSDTRNEFDSHTDDIDAHIIESTAALQSFWNEAGTRQGIRSAQSKTMLAYMDLKTDPCVDFYKYACGNWEKKHPIPKDKAGFDTFEMLRESLDLVLKQLLESQSFNSTSSSQEKTPFHQNPIKDNHYETNPKSEADIAEAGITDLAAFTMSKSNDREQLNVLDQEQELRAALLRKEIVRKRRMLGRILTRYKRRTTNTKRKRLIEPPRQSEPKPEPAAPALNLNDSAGSVRIAEPIPYAEYLKPHYDAQVKAKNLYKSCVNSQLLNRRGLEPLHKLIRDLGGWPVLNSDWNGQNFDWQHLAASLRRYNNDILIVEWVGPDIKNSEENVVQFDQTSLGLPTREYFLQETNSKYLLAYQRFMSEIMHKLGARKTDALRTAAELIAFETQLASITAPAEQRLNVTKLYKRMTLKQLHMIVPQINWIRYLSTLQERQVKDTEEVVIYATEYMKQLVTLIAETEPRTLDNFMMWRFVRHRINNVDDRFDDIKQTFYHALFGREESPQRWKVCIAQVNTNLGMAVGSMFVSRYFDDNSKRDTLRMTHELQQAFRDILKTTDWLDHNTKTLAEQKVNAMSLKIGYPDFILNTAELNEKYAGIEVHPDQYFENTLNVLLHTSKTEQSKLHERVNKTNWQTAPAIVNAYYSRNKNQIMFPAGILQPPFYHRYFPKALNFGGIGVVIGHELTHGFDDKGRLFDSNGNIHKWWSDSAIRGFDERARCIISQYSNYTVDEVGIALNGESTQGENIADNGGLRQAFHAYKRWINDNPVEASDEVLPGINMTGTQLFFLNFGQVWCGAMRPEAIRNKLNTAIHSPGRFRVIGTLSNSYDFAHEFHCPAGTPMNPFHKCSVW